MVVKSEVYGGPERIPLSLNPNHFRLRQPDHIWGSNNRFALLSACREIYHDVRPILYGQNDFLLKRPKHQDFNLPRFAPDMPFHLIRSLRIEYPESFGPCEWDLSHVWTHLLEDALVVTSRFRYLERLDLNLDINSNDYSSKYIHRRNYKHIRLWNAFVDQDTRITREIVASLNELNGKKMPSCVRFHFYYTALESNTRTHRVYDHDFNATGLNEIIRGAGIRRRRV